MKKVPLVLIAAMTACSPAVFAAVQQIIPLANTVAIDANGTANGVQFTGVSPGGVLQIPSGDINSTFPTNFTSAASTVNPNAGTLNFQDTSGVSTVHGTVGAIGLELFNINGGLGSSTIVFTGGAVLTNTFNVTGNGAMEFQNTTTGALQFNTDGTLILDPGVLFTGAVTNLSANTGTISLNSASTLTGGAGTAVSPVKQINVIGGNATLNGAIAATNFTLATNTLSTGGGALTLPAEPVIINTTVLSDTLFGNVNAGANNDQINAAGVTINVDASQALLSGAPLFIVRAGMGTSNVPITVNSGGVRYSFIGQNLNGNITITPTAINPGGTPAGTTVNALAGIAAANPGSDLAYVQMQLNALPTVSALANALLQISPGPGLVGVNRSSFNTAKQFQKVWLEHLQRNHEYCFFEGLDDCCNFPPKQRDRAAMWSILA